MDDALGLLSLILLDLYDAAAPAEGSAFRLWALERLQALLPFSGAAWAYGAKTDGGLVLHHISLLGFPAGFADVIRATAAGDPTAPKMMGASGKSFIHSRADYPVEMLKLAADPNGLRSSLEGMIVDPDSGLFGTICLFRNERLPAFKERDRALHEALLPHWLKAPARRLIANAASVDTTGELIAVADLNGVLEAAAQPFIEMLRLEWPEWEGGVLPGAFVREPARKRRHAGQGAHIAWRVAAIGNRLIVRVRPVRGADKLGERERQIATLLGDGLTLKDVAAKLHLAPSTVKNHRDNIYHKLGVSSRLELLQSLREGGGST